MTHEEIKSVVDNFSFTNNLTDDMSRLVEKLSAYEIEIFGSVTLTEILFENDNFLRASYIAEENYEEMFERVNDAILDAIDELLD